MQIKPELLALLTPEQLAHPAATENVLYLLFTVRGYQSLQPNAPQAELVQVMQVVALQAGWSKAELFQAVTDFKQLLWDHPELADVEVILPTQKAALA